MRIISVTNQKGGCGKTTTAVNLSACLAANGKKVLLIDLDPQAHATLGLNIRAEACIYNVLSKISVKKTPLEGIIKKVTPGFDIAPSGIVLSTLEQELAGEIRARSLELYREASAYALSRGIILADTKFEFGRLDGQLVLGDEIFTPDSTRFWELNEYEPGRAQKSFDKQYLREWLETLDWDKTPPPPALPEPVIAATAAKYREAYERLTGKTLP